MHTAAAPATYRVQRTPGQRGLGRSRSGDSSGRRASESTGTEGRDGSARARSPNRQDPRLEQVREQRHACCCVALVYSELRAACGHCRVCGWCVRPLVRVYFSPFLTISPPKNRHKVSVPAAPLITVASVHLSSTTDTTRGDSRGSGASASTGHGHSLRSRTAAHHDVFCGHLPVSHSNLFTRPEVRTCLHVVCVWWIAFEALAHAQRRAHRGVWGLKSLYFSISLIFIPLSPS